jgi:hypothetical protein
LCKQLNFWLNDEGEEHLKELTLHTDPSLPRLSLRLGIRPSVFSTYCD